METTNEPQSLTDVIWQEFQQQAFDIGHKAIDMASSSVLYVAKELVFALSGDVAAADTDNYGMRNDLEEEDEIEVEGDDDDVNPDDVALVKALRQELERESSKTAKKKSKKKHKKDKTKSRKETRSVDVEKRDEESERAHKVEDLIKKFDASTVVAKPKWRSTVVEGNVGRTPAMNKPTYDVLVTNSSRSNPVQSAKPNHNNTGTTTSRQKYDTLVVRPLSTSRGNQAKQSQPSEKSQDIFRPRSASEIIMDDSERFAYLVGNDRSMGPPKPENLFSPFASFKEMHQANKALLDDTTFDTRSDRESAHPSSSQIEPSTSATPGTTDPIPEIVDIRTEIEDVQRIIAKLEEERTQRRLQEENGMDMPGEMSNKDPMKAEEIRTLIRRLARLSERHRELKSKNAALSRQGDNETRVPAAV